MFLFGTNSVGKELFPLIVDSFLVGLDVQESIQAVTKFVLSVL